MLLITLHRFVTEMAAKSKFRETNVEKLNKRVLLYIDIHYMAMFKGA